MLSETREINPYACLDITAFRRVSLIEEVVSSNLTSMEDFSSYSLLSGLGYFIATCEAILSVKESERKICSNVSVIGNVPSYLAILRAFRVGDLTALEKILRLKIWTNVLQL